MTFWDAIAYIAAVIGGLIVLLAAVSPASAPQQGALAAIGIGVAACPYFIAATAHRAKIRKYYAKVERREDAHREP
jgi:hypothetical protein